MDRSLDRLDSCQSLAWYFGRRMGDSTGRWCVPFVSGLVPCRRQKNLLDDHGMERPPVRRGYIEPLSFKLYSLVV